MVKFTQDINWKLYEYRNKKRLVWGLKHRKIMLYPNELIEKLRNIYYGGVPASIVLLSNGMSNGFCYDRALLMSRAFLDDDVDVKLVYASVDSLSKNPIYKSGDDLAYDHCFVEIMKDNKEYVIDTSSGLIYDKKTYYSMEHPKIRHVNTKEDIIKFVYEDDVFHPEDLENDKYAMPAILPFIEMTYGKQNELYSMLGIEMLQEEIKLFKDKINYDEVVEIINKGVI